MSLIIEPVTPQRWRDLVALFGERGAYSGCWCMYFRQSSEEFRTGAGQPNRRALQRLVRGERIPGLLAYLDGEPVGWVSVAPRPEFSRVERSRTTKPIDDEPVWSIVCFYIDRGHRGRGVATALLDGAVKHAARNGARIVEGYPLDREGKIPSTEAYYGTIGMFRDAGFTEVARRSDVRPIMRKAVGAASRTRLPAGTRKPLAASRSPRTAAPKASTRRADRRS